MDTVDMIERHNASILALSDCVDIAQLAAENKELKESNAELAELVNAQDEENIDLKAMLILNGITEEMQQCKTSEVE